MKGDTWDMDASGFEGQNSTWNIPRNRLVTSIGVLELEHLSLE